MHLLFTYFTAFEEKTAQELKKSDLLTVNKHIYAAVQAKMDVQTQTGRNISAEQQLWKETKTEKPTKKCKLSQN